MNTAWTAFIAEQGAVEPAGDAFMADLPHIFAVGVEGHDAVTFLHGQFSGDIGALQPGASGFTAWCDAKGRVITTLVATRTAGGFQLLLPAVLQDAVLKRLRMFVLRSDVNFTELSPGHVSVGVAGPSAAAAADAFPGVTSARLPAVAGERRICSADADTMMKLWRELAPACAPVDTARWRRADIEAGLPWLAPQTSAAFLPQELNVDQLGGLSYSKGCYPGQEIIARVHYRGRLKRRLHVGTVRSDSAPAAGLDIVGETAGRAVGTVIDAAPRGPSEYGILAVMSLEHLAEALHLEHAGGPSLHLRAAPETSTP